MAQPLTKKDLNEALKPLATKQGISASEERLAESIRGINFGLSQHLSGTQTTMDYIARNTPERWKPTDMVAAPYTSLT